MSNKRAISKEKAVAICADLLYSGKQRKEIVQELTKAYNLSERGIDNYIKAARVVVSKRNQADEEVRARVQAEQTEEVARKLGLSREWALSKLKRIADLDVRKIFNEDGTRKKVSELDDETAAAIASIEMQEVRTATGQIGTNLKIKGDPRITAIGEIGKILGWTGATTLKAELEDKKGEKAFKVTLNLG